MKIGRAAPLADQVYAALHADIAECRLKAGDRLPIEPQMAAQFGVSRTVIREAISRLRNDGLVLTRQGVGAFVAAAPVNRTFRLSGQTLEDAEAVREIFELRLGIEVEAAALAAKRRTPADLQRMEKALKQIAATTDGPDLGVEADAAFHRAIAVGSGNSKIASFQRYLSVFLVQSIKAARENTRKTHPGRAEDVFLEHQAILAAIRAEDPNGASLAMRAHLRNAQGRLGLLAPEGGPRMRKVK